MAGAAPRQFTPQVKAEGLVRLAANDGNVKRTAREMGVQPATVRRWRDQAAVGNGPGQALIVAVREEFVTGAERVRDKSLSLLEARIDAGEIKSGELITVLGVLDDKIVRAKGMPTSTVQHQSALPNPEDLKDMMQAFVAGAITAAEQRHDVIVEAELVSDETPIAGQA